MKRTSAILGTALFFITYALPITAMAQALGRQWIGTWSASPAATAPPDSGFAPPFGEGFNNQTVRNIVHTSVGGSAVRVRLTNRFGTQPVTFNGAYVGIAQAGATIVSGSNHALTFGGSTSVTIPAGAEALSDPLPFVAPSEGNLAISLFAESGTGTPTVHLEANQTNYVATGDFAGSEDGSEFTGAVTSWYFVNGVDVLTSPRLKGAVVVLGDSIADGTASTVDANRRWPNYLARRFLGNPSGLQMSVLDEGFGANRVLTDSPCFGPSAVNRVETDVLGQTGVRYVILNEGLNDIGFPTYPFPFVCIDPNLDMSADQIIAGYEQIIAKVHAKGLKIFAGTLTPFKDAWYWTLEGEAKREEINSFIKTSGTFDGVIDFAAAVADSNDPRMLAPQFNSGDNVHPNDAGYEAMANAVDMSLFLPRR